jgi:predicted dehydrogenase
MNKESTIRYFLKHSAAFATGTLILPHIIPSTSLGMGGKLPPGDRIVLRATGNCQLGTDKLKDFLELPKAVQFVATCDVVTTHSERSKELIDVVNKNNACKIYGDNRGFLENEKLDEVTIALPDQWHGLVYIAVADKKPDVLTGKSLASTFDDSQAIVSAAKRNNIVWQTGRRIG